MSKSKNWELYKRLFTFAKPYRKVLIFGILCGLIVGGSMVGILRNIAVLIEPFEDTARISQDIETNQPELYATNENTLNKSSADNYKHSITSTDNLENASVEDESEKEQEKKNSSDKMFGPAMDIAQYFGIEGIDKNGKLTAAFALISVFILVLFFSLKIIATSLNQFAMRYVGANVVKDLRTALFSHIQNQSLSYFAVNKVGDLTARINHDTSVVDRVVSNNVSQLTRCPMELAAIMVFISYYTIQNGLYIVPVILFGILPIFVLPLMLLTKMVRKKFKQALKQISNLNEIMYEVLTGIRVVKAYGMEEVESKRFFHKNRKYVRKVLSSLKYELGISGLAEALNIFAICCFVIFCYLNGVSLAQLFTMVTATIFAYKPLKQLMKVNTQIQRSLVAVERIFETLDTHMEIPDPQKPIIFNGFRENITFKNVDFSYEQDRKVLNDVTIEVPKGKVVAFVGSAGSGKSTIANLFCRFYDPDHGEILLDGIPINQIKIQELRKLIGVVTQDNILFNDTIANNICYGLEEPDRDRIIEAAKKAKAHEFIMEKDGGYDAIVGDKGFMLSGGQKQRITIARAFYKNPDILVLDEATSALDSVTEREVQQELSKLMKGRTVFAIAHRLSTIRDADCIYVLSNGKIIEQGTHSELIELDGSYAEMYKIQSEHNE